MKILITGAGGFVGKHLIERLQKNHHELVALGLGCDAEKFKQQNIPLYAEDILDETAVEKCMEKEKPDAVIHLAAISNVPLSWEKPGLTADVNVKGTINVFLAFAHANPKGVFLNIGSSDEYGLTAKQGVPLTEDMPCQPQNPYAISKLCAEQMVLQLGKKYGVKVISTRSFNHFGPGQAKGFVVSDFASQIAEIERGEREPVIKVGDLSAWRDFSYVGDVVDAYARLLEEDAPAGVYNVCSGQAVRIEEILRRLLAMSKIEIQIAQDKDKMRPSEVAYFVGDGSKYCAQTYGHGKGINNGLKEVLDWWLQNL